jgi:rod shape-determining protein MreD
MRWVYFLILILLGVILQTTLVQLLWFQTALGWIGPELLAAVAVFVALNARNRTDAALAGWALGFGLDLTLSGPAMGLLPLLYAAAGAGLQHVREAFFRERAVTQMLLTFAFCAFVYEAWTLWDVLVGDGERLGRRVLQALGLSAYTAVLAPLVYAALRRIDAVLLAMPVRRGKR